MPADPVADLAARLDALAAGLTGDQLREVLTTVGVAAKKDLDQSIKRDLGGDNKFSGWAPRLGSGFEHTAGGRITLTPRPPGPWTVAESGRFRGSRVARKGRYRGRRVGWGNTAPKRSWSDGVGIITRDTPERALTEIVALVRKVVL